MKIAIMTWFHYRNYGTALQVYALSNYLGSMGHDVEVIQYYPKRMGQTLPDNSFHTTIKRVFGRRVAKLIPGARKNSILGSRVSLYRPFCDEEKDKLFDDFINSNLRFSKICKTLSDLESLNNQYDVFICGSDQIWAPSIFDPHYFLDFVQDTNKLVAYAPSIGLYTVKDKYVYQQMSDLIRRFRCLSIREEQGAQIIKKMTGRNAEVVSDPTLLLSAEEWTDICKSAEMKNNPYMVVYMLGHEETHWQEVYRIADERHLDVKIIPVFECDFERKGCIEYSIGPLEFLALFKKASYVLTDSFHGTLFSILFHKQFCVFERFAKTDSINQNSRVINILKITNTLDRLIPYGKTCEAISDIDFENVEYLLKHLINSSKKYLNTSLDTAQYAQENKQQNHILIDRSLCCGCGACSSVCPKNAISIEMNEAGFYHAAVDENKCIACGKCKTVCQFEVDKHGLLLKDGRYYSYKDSDSAVLQQSSSGGIAYRLSSMLLHDGYAVVGCTFDVSSQKATHIYIENEKDLHKLQGSKYMQSSFSQVLPLIKSSKKPVVIFGTPCQVAAARLLFADRNDIVYVDLICHGVPTYNLYKKYKDHLANIYGSKQDDLYISFRYKPKGWRKIHIYTSDGKIETCFSQKEDLYFRMFESMNCYAPACYDCKWRDGTLADLRIGDFWGPLFENDSTGVSIIGCMTEKGASVLSELRDLNRGLLESQSSEHYLNIQQTKNGSKPLFYDELLNRLNDSKQKLDFIVEKYVEPFERTPVRRTVLNRGRHILRLMADHYFSQ